ncbi:glycerol-3-phosphate dehydrogenase/oxidase [Leucobacter luti]|uniref:Glycerol-3-phosphate dehydrogenase n=1 Tax=Leucobacter luti TaxID=340320 RepID=A0A4Q7U7D9_9MICO|nr:glycerol-3-phosphate dehydrogenase/oxidase [Leucobacter luti]MBL3700932.1 glycerol-3-phosphate dehydrogenase/oxidase [Leucobacter luti]RZT68847.1 glycerol-3-phosphate dehydrogenase [Leucobacter luti]
MTQTRRGDLNEASRAHSLAHLAEHEVDVLVIGGGVTGAGVALDAATRGLSVALCEAADLASGTSGFSSKLVHGGLRYLARGDLPLAWESAVERAALMRRIAPHLVRPRAFLVPRFGGGASGAAADALSETGIRIADLLRVASGLPASVLPRPRRVDPRGARLLAPALRQEGLRGGIVYWDGALEDDVRLVVALARTAARHGAHVLTGCRVLSASERGAVIDAGPAPGSDTSAAAPRTELRIRARVVINAAGVWAGDFAPGLPMTPSRGTHLVISSATLGHPRAVMTAPVPGHFGRYVFVLPQSNGLCYLGLTDEPAPGADGYAPAIPDTDVDFLLRVANAALDTPLTRADVLSSFAGLRPLLGAGTDSANASRRHLLRDRPGEPITITGGKLTAYRRMAEEAVDAAVRRLGGDPRARAAVTARVPLLGSPGSGNFPGAGNAGQVQWPGADPGGTIAARLTARYGWEAARVAALAAADPILTEELAPGAGVTGAEVRFAVLAEGARTPEDVLHRRTRLAFDPERSSAAAPAVAALLARDSPRAQGRGDRSDGADGAS